MIYIRSKCGGYITLTPILNQHRGETNKRHN